MQLLSALNPKGYGAPLGRSKIFYLEKIEIKKNNPNLSYCLPPPTWLRKLRNFSSSFSDETVGCWKAQVSFLSHSWLELIITTKPVYTWDRYGTLKTLHKLLGIYEDKNCESCFTRRVCSFSYFIPICENLCFRKNWNSVFSATLIGKPY